MSIRPRVIVALPDAAESIAVADWLTADGCEPVRRAGAQAVLDEIRHRRFDLLIADTTLSDRAGLPALVHARHPQAFVLLVGDGPERSRAAGGITYLQRPLERVTLCCFVWMDMLDRRPVRRSLRKVVAPFDVTVSGIPAQILDVSSDGVRVELPRDCTTKLPGVFALKVPLMGLTVRAQRMWMRSSRHGAVMCGSALTHNRPAAAQGWVSFTEMMPPVAGGAQLSDPTAAPALERKPARGPFGFSRG